MKPGGSPARPVRVRRVRDGTVRRARDAVAVEEPLEIRVAWTDAQGLDRVDAVAVTMRTPGDDFELVAGFLHGEGLLRHRDDLHELTYCLSKDHPQQYNVVEARLRTGVSFDVGRLHRNFYTSSSCGVCGKASLDAVEAQGCAVLGAGPTVTAEILVDLPDRLQEAQGVFRRTGGLHAAGLFSAAGDPRVVREDVGRHNAVDKAVGHHFLQGGLPAREDILVVSGRASFEIVQKSVAAGIPLLVAVGAPSSLALDLADRFGQTVVGFVRDGGFNVYTGDARVAA